MQCPNIQVGDVVNIKEDNVPPLVWKLGVVSNLHLGLDDIVRVVMLRTANKTLETNKKISILPRVH
jgi:hypothetical protein